MLLIQNILNVKSLVYLHIRFRIGHRDEGNEHVHENKVHTCDESYEKEKRETTTYCYH